jgi:hypothetical protein
MGMQLLLADRSPCNESANNDLFGCIAEGEVIRLKIPTGQKIRRLLIVPTPKSPEDQALFFHLDNFVVSTVSCGQYYLVSRRKAA